MERSLVGYGLWGHERAGHDYMTKHQQAASSSLCKYYGIEWNYQEQTQQAPGRYLLLLLLLSHFSCVRLCATPQTAAHQAPLSMGFSKQVY